MPLFKTEVPSPQSQILKLSSTKVSTPAQRFSGVTLPTQQPVRTALLVSHLPSQTSQYLLTQQTALIVYMPNTPYIFHSNVTTFTPSYTDAVRNAIIENGHDIATMGNGTLDKEWPTCMACAVLSRSFYKTNTTVPAACRACFTKYCWDGSLDTTTPATPFYPTYKLGELKIKSAAGPVVGLRRGALVGAVVLSAFMLA